MKLLLVPQDSPFLKLKTKPVEYFNSMQKSEIDEMFNLMTKENGVGLAAPQVGLDKSLFVIDVPFAIKEGSKSIKTNIKRIFINPELTLSGEDISIKEGCLSFPRQVS